MPIRILLCLHHYLNPNQGAPGLTLALGKALEALGCEVQFYGFEHGFPGIENGGIDLALKFPWKLAGYLTRHAADFDIIDVSTGDAWVWSSLGRPGAAKRHALITRSHGLEHIVDANHRQEDHAGTARLSWKYPLYHGGFRLWEVAKSLQQADRALFSNQHDREYSIRELGVRSERTHLFVNGVPESFLGQPLSGIATSSSIPIQIALIGSYITRKGIVYACQALNNVLTRHPQIKVTFFGSGCPEEQVHADFDPSVRAQVRVVPNYARAELPELLQGYQIMLFPSLSEGFSLALPEAMACGLAPVATAIPGNVEIARDAENALLVPSRDSQAIEYALERLIADPGLLHHLRCEAYLTAQTYRWSQIATDTLSLYEEALHTRAQK